MCIDKDEYEKRVLNEQVIKKEYYGNSMIVKFKYRQTTFFRHSCICKLPPFNMMIISKEEEWVVVS